jgi:hypothetical protein
MDGAARCYIACGYDSGQIWVADGFCVRLAVGPSGVRNSTLRDATGSTCCPSARALGVILGGDYVVRKNCWLLNSVIELRHPYFGGASMCFVRASSTGRHGATSGFDHRGRPTSRHEERSAIVSRCFSKSQKKRGCWVAAFRASLYCKESFIERGIRTLEGHAHQESIVRSRRHMRCLRLREPLL